MSEREIPRDEAEAALQTRRELGSEYEPAIVDSFVDRIDKAIERRVADHVARRIEDSDQMAKVQAKAHADTAGHRLALAIVSLALSVPLTAIAASSTAGIEAIVLIWVAIVLVNAIFAWGSRMPRNR